MISSRTPRPNCATVRPPSLQRDLNCFAVEARGLVIYTAASCFGPHSTLKSCWSGTLPSTAPFRRSDSSPLDSPSARRSSADVMTGLRCLAGPRPAALWHLDGPRDNLPLVFLFCPKHQQRGWFVL